MGADGNATQNNGLLWQPGVPLAPRTPFWSASCPVPPSAHREQGSPFHLFSHAPALHVASWLTSCRESPACQLHQAMVVVPEHIHSPVCCPASSPSWPCDTHRPGLPRSWKTHSPQPGVPGHPCSCHFLLTLHRPALTAADLGTCVVPPVPLEAATSGSGAQP